MHDELLSRDEAARLLKVSTRHVDRLIRKHGLPALRLGHRVVIRRRELERWLDQQAMRDKST